MNTALDGHFYMAKLERLLKSKRYILYYRSGPSHYTSEMGSFHQSGYSATKSITATGSLTMSTAIDTDSPHSQLSLVPTWPPHNIRIKQDATVSRDQHLYTGTLCSLKLVQFSE